jgi:hypothetical protein
VEEVEEVGEVEEVHKHFLVFQNLHLAFLYKLSKFLSDKPLTLYLVEIGLGGGFGLFISTEAGLKGLGSLGSVCGIVGGGLGAVGTGSGGNGRSSTCFEI